MLARMRVRPWLASVSTGAALLALDPRVAWALDQPAGGGDHAAAAPASASAQTGLLRVVLGLALVFALAVVAAHPFVRRLERRLGLTVVLSSGLPFIAMGVVFRLPSVGILSDAVVDDLRPALEFGVGWLGFVVGMQFDVRELDKVPPKTGGAVAAESVIPMVASALAASAFFVALDPVWAFGGARSVAEGFSVAFTHTPLRDGLALGACAAQTAPVAAVAIARGGAGPGSLAAKLLDQITRIDDVAGVALLGLICAFFRPTDAFAAWKLPHIAWIFVTLGMGGVLGILSYVLVRGARSGAEEIAYLLGAIALSAGMSGYLAISPLVTCAIAGALLINLPHDNFDRLKATMNQVERPLYLIFLVVAGALWDLRAWQGWALVPLFVLGRVGGKLSGAYVAKKVGPAELPDATTLGLALAPQSPIAIATIVSYITIYRGQEAESKSLHWLMTACIGGALLTEILVQTIARLRGDLSFDVGAPSLASMSPPSMPPGAIEAAPVVIPAPPSLPSGEAAPTPHGSDRPPGA